MFAQLKVTIPSYVRNPPRQRKKRIIKNGIVNVDDVHIACGSKNINWLKIAKRKLTERELKLLQKRQRILDRIIMNAIESFVDEHLNRFNFKMCTDIYEEDIREKLMNPQSVIMLRCAQDIAATLNKWRGYKPDEESHSFRAYFQRCRHWFDTKKITLMSHYFWIPIMKLIEEFATKTSVQFFGHRPSAIRQAYSEYLNVLILKTVFEGQIKPANARNMWLVPAMSYPKFLRKYNEKLQINLPRSSKKNKDIRQQYLQCLNNRHDSLRAAFDHSLNEYCASNGASQPSSFDNSNVFSIHNAHSNPLPNLGTDANCGMFKIGADDKFPFELNHMNNNMQFGPSQDLSPSYAYPFSPPYAPSYSNHNNGNAFACNQDPYLMKNQGAIFNANEFSFRMPNNKDFAFLGNPSPPSIPPPIRPAHNVHNLTKDYMNYNDSSTNWYENQLSFPYPSGDCKCNPWCDWFPVDFNTNRIAHDPHVTL